MTVNELIQELQKLDPATREMPVKILYWAEEEVETGIGMINESRKVAEEIDTVIQPQTWGIQKDCVCLESRN